MLGPWEWADNYLLLSIQLGGSIFPVAVYDSTQEDVLSVIFTDLAPIGQVNFKGIINIVLLGETAYDQVAEHIQRQGYGWVIESGELVR